MKQTFLKLTTSPSAAVATNDTIVFTAPSGYTAATTLTASGALLYAYGLGTLFTQGASNFSVSYSTDVTVTYLGSTSIPAGTQVDFFIPQVDAFAALTDNSGGTASNTLAVVTLPTLSTWNGSSVYPSAAQGTAINAAFTSLTNAVASLAAKVASIQTALKNAGLNVV